MRRLFLSVVLFFVTHGLVAETEHERRTVAVSAYQQGFGLVRDEVTLSPARAETDVVFYGLAKLLRPETVVVDAKGFVLLEQAFSAQPLSQQRLLRDYVGKTLYLDTYNAYQDRTDRVEATLLAYEDVPVYSIAGEVYLSHPGRPVLPTWAERGPSLSWRVKQSAGPASGTLKYLVDGLGWQADYVLNLNDEENSAALQGWATVTNSSGADYDEVELSLIAGDVHRASAVQARSLMMRAEAADYAPEASSLGEYYEFKFERPVSLSDHQSKQLQFLLADGIDVKKELRVRTSNPYLRQSYEVPVPIAAELRYIFDSPTAMPAGIVRVYLGDRMLGEDRITHSGLGFEVDLQVGRAFDVRVKRSQIDYQRLTSKRHRSQWRIDVESAKELPTELIVDEVLGGDWRIVDSSIPFEKLDASSVRFRPQLRNLRKFSFTYTVEVDY